MLPIQEQNPEQAPEASPEPVRSALLTGDLGVVVLRALLEHGVGYVVGSWNDRPTPIDAAIDDARDSVLARRGVVIRRLRSQRALEPLVTAPIGGITGAPPRGAVVFSGRHGLRPTLEHFSRIRSNGAVVAFCFDEDVLRIDDAIVVDPEPTAAGLSRAIGDAFAASHAAGRPALVLLRDRAVGMRGTLRLRRELAPDDAAQHDARTRTEPVDAATAACASGLVEVHVGAAPRPRRALYAAGPMRIALERSLAALREQAAARGVRIELDDVAIIASRASGIVPDERHAAGRLLAAVRSTCVLGTRAAAVAERLEALGVQVDATHALDPGSLRGDVLVSLVASWLADAEDLDPDVREALAAIATDARAADADVVPIERVPRRGDVLHRSIPAPVAAGLTLAQGVIGVPGRVHPEYPTYRTDTGVALTVAPAATFAQHGIAAAAPDTGIGVVLVVGSADAVAAAAGSAGASIEYVDAGSPRAIGRAVAAACRAPRATWHVVVARELQHVAAPRSGAFGMDPDLAGTERLAVAAMPTAAAVLVATDDELADGPAVLALDRPEAHAALDHVRELSPATWDLHVRPIVGRGQRLSWNLRRRLVRTSAGVDL